MTLLDVNLAWREATGYFRAGLNREERRWATPGELAREIDPRTINTPALDLIDDALVDLADGKEQRLAIFMSPQEGKSERASHYFPLWMLANNPECRIAIVSYSGEIARRWGWLLRQDIETYNGTDGNIDLGLRLGPRPPAGRFVVEGHRGGVYCVGIAGSLTGRAVDLLIIDDPIKDLEQAQSIRYRDRAGLFWQAVAIPRMGPHTKTVLIQCMTGDTPVLMGDGTEKPLRDVRPGDTVATYEDGALATSTVRNWANQGPDSIYTIRMKSGRVVRANARHPFLTIEDGKYVWRRTASLRPGSLIQTATGASGGASSAPPTTSATSPLNARACARRTTTNSGGPMVSDRHRSTLSADERPTSSTGTASTRLGSPPSSPSRAGSAPSAANPPRHGIPVPTGTGSSASTTTTSPARCVGCSATTATSPSGTASPPRSCAPPLRTWNLEPDEVVEVAACGTEEDVFDLQIDRTENFIANGLVSHNTRWHEDDLAGRLLASEGNKDKGGKWKVISIPAQCEDEATDPLRRKLGEFMVSTRGRTPEQWAERRKDVGEYVWSALFQQRPAPAEGGLFKRLWWRYWTPAVQIGNTPRLNLGGRVIALSDCWRFATVDLANSTKTSADWTVISAWAKTLDGDLVLLDRVRARIGEGEHFAHARPLVERWNLDTVFVEATQHSTTIVREATQNGIPISPLKAEQDKFTRALPASAWCSNGRVWLPAGAWWLKTWLDEHASFPAAANDDQVDTFAYAIRVAVTGWNPTPSTNPAPPPPPAAPAEGATVGASEVDFETVAF